MSDSTQQNSDFTKQMVEMMFDSMREGALRTSGILWDALMKILLENLLIILSVIFVLFLIATIRALLGYWAPLGSLLYNTLYFGTLLVVGLVWGPEVFVADVFRFACTVLLYPTCYLITRWILDKTGLKRS